MTASLSEHDAPTGPVHPRGPAGPDAPAPPGGVVPDTEQGLQQENAGTSLDQPSDDAGGE